MEPRGAWLVFGFSGQALFSARFVVQWLVARNLMLLRGNQRAAEAH